jgi:hypothetical protein
MDSSAERSLREYLSCDHETLLEALADSLLGMGPGWGPLDIDRRIEFAREWLERRIAELRGELCGEVWSRLKESGGIDRLSDAAIIADAIATVHGRPTANIVAVILLRRGLESLCGSEA